MEWLRVGSDINGEAISDQSGWSVSLSADGTRVAIGALFNDGNGGSSDAGHVRIYDYEFSSGAWSQLGADIDGEASNDSSGTSVSLSADGTRVAIGATGNNRTGSDAGHVRIYEFSDATGWSQLGSDINGEASYDYSGCSVSLSDNGTRVAIGATGNDGTGSYAGHVRIYEFSNGAWSQVGQDIDGEAAADESGWSVSLSDNGSRVAIGAPYNDGTGGDAGHVRIYEFSDATGWSQLGADINGEGISDQSGYSVSLSADGSRVAIGAPYNDGTGYNAGHVRIYEFSSGTWSQVGQDIDGEAEHDYSGYSVSLSADGTRVAIGAAGNDGNGSLAGHVRIYEFSSTTGWSQLGQDIDGEAEDDSSGFSVSLSTDGTRVAIGATYNDGTGSNAGHVRIYEFVSTTTTEAPTHQTILSLESFGTSMNGTTGKTNYVWQLKATTTSL